MSDELNGADLRADDDKARSEAGRMLGKIDRGNRLANAERSLQIIAEKRAANGGKLTEEHRQAIADAQKRRWEERKASMPVAEPTEKRAPGRPRKEPVAVASVETEPKRRGRPRKASAEEVSE